MVSFLRAGAIIYDHGKNILLWGNAITREGIFETFKHHPVIVPSNANVLFIIVRIAIQRQKKNFAPVISIPNTAVILIL